MGRFLLHPAVVVLGCGGFVVGGVVAYAEQSLSWWFPVMGLVLGLVVGGVGYWCETRNRRL